MKQNKDWIVNVSQTWSTDIRVKAKTAAEAKAKAWATYKNKRASRRNYKLYADKQPIVII